MSATAWNQMPPGYRPAEYGDGFRDGLVAGRAAAQARITELEDEVERLRAALLVLEAIVYSGERDDDLRARIGWMTFQNAQEAVRKARAALGTGGEA